MAIERNAPSGPLADALEQVGDRWSLLVVDALIAGPQRFADLLEGIEGVASNVLASRLRRLERDGVVIREPYVQRPLRHIYRLTASGAELAGAVRLLAQWGAAHRGAGSPSADDAGLVHDTCGTAVDARWYCPTCAVVIDDREAAELRWI